MRLRRATPADAALLRHWDGQAHVVASDPNDDWAWETELAREPDWREQRIAELGARPVGFVQIIDPAREDSHYWGEVAPNLRAVDLWIGEASDLGKGLGTWMMELALERCLRDPAVQAVLIDPLASNTRAHRFYERLGFHFLERRRFGADDCRVYRLARGEVRGAMREIRTPVLALEPQLARHAAQMFAVLSDPAIYAYENAPPASPEALRARFEKLASRRSADGRERWLNWVVRLPGGELIGYVQATVYPGGLADIAYVFASAWWGRGLARHAVEAMIGELAACYGVHGLHAVLRAGNQRSLRLLERLGFVRAGAGVAPATALEPGELLMTRDAAVSREPGTIAEGSAA